MKLMDMMDTKRYRELMAIEDPYSYRERFTMPKLLIDSAGD
jgi:PhoPQ-activated pathogenicity-related protein